MKKGYIYLAILIGVNLWLSGYFIGRGTKTPSEPLSQRTDTITLVDTIKVIEPKLDTILSVKRVPYPIEMFDTIHDTIFLAREYRSYKDSTYRAVVSGVDPRLEEIEVYQRTNNITTTIEVEKKVKPKFSVGLQGGMGAGTKGLTPYVGIGIQYNLFSF